MCSSTGGSFCFLREVSGNEFYSYCQLYINMVKYEHKRTCGNQKVEKVPENGKKSAFGPLPAFHRFESAARIA